MSDDAPVKPTVATKVKAWRPAYARWRAELEAKGLQRPLRPIRPPGIVSRSDLQDKNGRRLCGSVVREPGPSGDWLCHMVALKHGTGRCRMHGGRAVLDAFPDGGTKPPGPKNADVLRELRLLGRFDDYRKDSELLDLRHELALMDLHIAQVFKEAMRDNDEDARKEFRASIATRKTLVDAIYKQQASVVPTSQVLAFMHAMVNLMFKYVKDPRDRLALLSDVRRIAGANATLEKSRIAHAIDVGAPAVATLPVEEPPLPVVELVE